LELVNLITGSILGGILLVLGMSMFWWFTEWYSTI
jgi:hypothetical protein